MTGAGVPVCWNHGVESPEAGSSDVEQRVTPLEPFFDLVRALVHPGDGIDSRFRYRNVRSFNRHLATVAVLALIPLALEVDALWAVAAVTAVLVVLIAYEAIRFREARQRVRADPSATLAEMRGMLT